jgi:hypothetical protein
VAGRGASSQAVSVPQRTELLPSSGFVNIKKKTKFVLHIPVENPLPLQKRGAKKARERLGKKSGNAVAPKSTRRQQNG